MTNKNISVSAINAFSDNYIWSIGSDNHKNIALVDPGDATVCIDYINKHQLTLTAILITHHHPDHVGGIEKLIQHFDNGQHSITVYGPANESIPQCHVKLVENDNVSLDSIGVNFSIIDLPGHTLGHIAYHTDGMLFCGDTLFSGGCGRLFEGTPQQMLHSLNKLVALPDHTKVYCAHEYTAANLNFALSADPENVDLIYYYNQVTLLREKRLSTIPSTIAQEKLVNPFLRTNQTAIQQSVSEYTEQEITNSLEAFTALRAWKDVY